MNSLGVMQKEDNLRLVWKHEAEDFTKWLAEEESLNILGEAIGISIGEVERESSVGRYSVDLYAVEEESNRKIVIENQLESTDHDHLGKIITYASGKEAEIIIWIVKEAREEHRQAIEWLNNNMADEIAFFLLEIELWRIGDSPLAPKFKIVEEPNTWARIMKEDTSLSKTRQVQLEFWEEYNVYIDTKDDYLKEFTKKKPVAENWLGLPIGSPHMQLTVSMNTHTKKINVAIYISGNSELHDFILSHHREIKEETGYELISSQGEKDFRLRIEADGDIMNLREEWESYFKWLSENALKFKEIALRYEKKWLETSN